MSSIFENKVIRAAALYGAIGVLATGAYAIGENTGYRPIFKKEFVGFMSTEFKLAMDTTQQLVKSVQWLELENLEKLYQSGVLSDQEKHKRCLLAYQLQAFYVKDCNWSAFNPNQQ